MNFAILSQGGNCSKVKTISCRLGSKCGYDLTSLQQESARHSETIAGQWSNAMPFHQRSADIPQPNLRTKQLWKCCASQSEGIVQLTFGIAEAVNVVESVY